MRLLLEGNGLISPKSATFERDARLPPWNICAGSRAVSLAVWSKLLYDLFDTYAACIQRFSFGNEIYQQRCLTLAALETAISR